MTLRARVHNPWRGAGLDAKLQIGQAVVQAPQDVTPLHVLQNLSLPLVQDRHEYVQAIGVGAGTLSVLIRAGASGAGAAEDACRLARKVSLETGLASPAKAAEENRMVAATTAITRVIRFVIALSFCVC